MAEVCPLDHVMLATPDLEATSADIERLTGVRPASGGQHPGQGTRNMLLSLGPGCYLELIGPDASQEQIGNFGERLKRLAGPMLLMFGVRTFDIDTAYAHARALGFWAFAPNGKRIARPIAMSRALPGGGLLKWRLLLLGADGYELGLPFFIQWEGGPPPSDSSATGCTLQKFWVKHPNAYGLAELYSELSISVNVTSGSASLNLIINTPNGAVTL